MATYIEFEFSHLDRFVSLVPVTAELKREMEQAGVNVDSDRQVFKYLAEFHLGLLVSNSDKWQESWELDDANRSDDGQPDEGDVMLWDVVLEDAGDRKISVIKGVRSLDNYGLKEAKDLVDAAPSAVLQAVPRDTADKAKAVLEQAGATVSIVPHEPEPEPEAGEPEPEPEPEPDEDDEYDPYGDYDEDDGYDGPEEDDEDGEAGSGDAKGKAVEEAGKALRGNPWAVDDNPAFLN